jgi:hypothetical protein
VIIINIKDIFYIITPATCSGSLCCIWSHSRSHIQDRNPLDEGSTPRRDLNLTIHITHKGYISVPPAGIQTALDTAVTEISFSLKLRWTIMWKCTLERQEMGLWTVYWILLAQDSVQWWTCSSFFRRCLKHNHVACVHVNSNISFWDNSQSIRQNPLNQCKSEVSDLCFQVTFVMILTLSTLVHRY